MSRLMAIEAERSALGCVLAAAALDADAGHRVLRRLLAAGLDQEHFSIASHAELYRLLIQMMEDGIPIDAVSVAAEIDRNHADPRLIARLRILAHEVPAIGAAERYARIVADAALTRELEERGAA